MGGGCRWEAATGEWKVDGRACNGSVVGGGRARDRCERWADRVWCTVMMPYMEKRKNTLLVASERKIYAL